MPLPQKVVDQLAREPARTPGWAGRLLMFSSTVFFIALGIYVGMAFGFEPYLQGQINALDNQKQGFGQQFSTEQQGQIVELHSQIANIKDLLDSHVALTGLYAWLETHTHQDVAFSKLTVDAVAHTAQLEGVAKNVNAFVEQINELQKQPEVTLVTFGRLEGETDGTWTFNLTITFTPSFLLQKGSFSEPAAPAASGTESGAGGGGTGGGNFEF